MKKLSFEKLKSQFEVITQDQLKKLVGGRGEITGEGTESSPYTISTTLYLDFSSLDSGEVDSIFLAATSMSTPVYDINGTYYRINVNLAGVDDYDDYIANNSNDQYGVFVSGEGSNGADFGWATQTKIGLYDDTIDNYAQSGEIMAGTLRHEIGHTLGLSDGYAPVMVDYQFDQHGNILNGPGNYDSGTIMKILEEGDGVDWATGSGN